METEIVQTFVHQSCSMLDLLNTQVSNISTRIMSVDWIAPGRDAFVSDFQSTSGAIRQLIDQGKELCIRAEQESYRWEEMADFSSKMVLGSSGGASFSNSTIDHNEEEWFNIPDWGVNGLSGIGWFKNINDWMISPGLLLFALRPGGRYLDEVRLVGSHFFKTKMLGLGAGYTTSKAATLVNNVSKFKVTKFTLLFQGVLLASDWAQDYQEYKDDGGWEKIISAGIYDTIQAGVGIWASSQGAVVGMAVGQALIPIPGVGAVVGGIVGSVLGSVTADAVLDDSLWELFGKNNPVDDWAIDNIYQSIQWAQDQF
jgi:hypothetical protein